MAVARVGWVGAGAGARPGRAGAAAGPGRAGAGGRGRALGLEVVAVQRLMGTVVSTKADKTVTVQVERKTKHPKYGKFVVSTKVRARPSARARPPPAPRPPPPPLKHTRTGFQPTGCAKPRTPARSASSPSRRIGCGDGVGRELKGGGGRGGGPFHSGESLTAACATQNYLVHDGEEEARMGDYVRIAACRPLSKHKKFTLSEILKRKNIAEEFLEKEEVDLS